MAKRPPKTHKKQPLLGRDRDIPVDDENREEELFFQEVSEELKQEKLLQVWKRYGRLVTGLAVIVLLAVSGWQWRQSEIRKEQALWGDQFAAALVLAQKGKAKEAAAAFEALANKSEGGYGGLARLRQASQLAKAGDLVGAARAYDALANDSDARPAFRKVATLLWALHSLGKADPKAVRARLKPLTATGSPWRHTALELTALYARKGGDVKGARALFKQLSKDKTAPAAIRGRAAEMLQILGQS